MARSMILEDSRIEEDWLRRLRHDLTEAQVARSNWFGDYRRAYDAYRSILPPKNWPWPDCSNLAPPMTPMAVEQTKRRLVMYYVQDREYIHLSPLSKAADALDKARFNEGHLRWQAENELSYWHLIDDFVGEYVTGGTGFIYLDWCTSSGRWPTSL